MQTLNNLSTLAYVKTTQTLRRGSKKVSDFINEERGASDILALIIVLGIVLAIGFAFRKQILKLVGDLWNDLVVSKDKNPETNVKVNEWGN